MISIIVLVVRFIIRVSSRKKIGKNVVVMVIVWVLSSWLR